MDLLQQRIELDVLIGSFLKGPVIYQTSVLPSWLSVHLSFQFEHDVRRQHFSPFLMASQGSHVPVSTIVL